MEAILPQLAESVSGAQNLAGLTRPLLQLLEAVTGMESTYLTTIDEGRGEQRILYSRNTKQMQIPEGLVVPWHDTLCKRSLNEGRIYTDNVAECWGDSEAAKALGIRTYLSQPVKDVSGGLYGTLCAASSSSVQIAPDTVRVLTLFAELIAQQVAREQLVQSLQKANEELASHAFIDPLTGIANRRMLLDEMKRMLAQAERAQRVLHVAFIDLDGFKAINDRHGHDIGDALLKGIAFKLKAALRASDLIARYGGDEFVVVTESAHDAQLADRLHRITAGRYDCEGLVIDYPGASVGVVTSPPSGTDIDALLAAADAAMYVVKQKRRAARL